MNKARRKHSTARNKYNANHQAILHHGTWFHAQFNPANHLKYGTSHHQVLGGHVYITEAALQDAVFVNRGSATGLIKLIHRVDRPCSRIGRSQSKSCF